ncbi:MAG: phosphate ABC transporter substrate-binding protein [Deltaproteobacteria bacterium]|nr:phosphate ABC transporter substrate-binding protein [Deltaproteobacteria bacterium]
MRKAKVSFFALLVLTTPGFLVSLNAAALAGQLTLAGSSTIQPVAEVLGQEFERLHLEARVNVQGGGSSVGITAPQSGLADIGMVSRALHAEEAQKLTPTTFAVDGIALIVHASNPLAGLSHQQVIDIYTGKVSNWQALGWNNARIVVVNKEEGRSTLELFEHYFALKGKFVRDAVIIGPNGQAIATVAGNPQAIAYVSIGSSEVAAKQGTPIKLLALDGVAATSANVKNGAYGLIRPLNFVTVGSPQGMAEVFLDFVLTPAGQHIVKEQEFVPVRDTIAQH